MSQTPDIDPVPKSVPESKVMFGGGSLQTSLKSGTMNETIISQGMELTETPTSIEVRIRRTGVDNPLQEKVGSFVNC